MSQKDINEVLTTSLLSHVLGGYAQPIETPLELPKFLCFCCGQRGHFTFKCPIIKICATTTMSATSPTHATSSAMSFAMS